MPEIRYGGARFSEHKQQLVLDELPAAMAYDCRFSTLFVEELIKQHGGDKRCRCCGALSRKVLTEKQVYAIANMLLAKWQKQSLVTFSQVLGNWRKLP